MIFRGKGDGEAGSVSCCCDSLLVWAPRRARRRLSAWLDLGWIGGIMVEELDNTVCVCLLEKTVVGE